MSNRSSNVAFATNKLIFTTNKKDIMKTENQNQTIVAFHVGRGGRYWNPGHVSFIGEKKIN